MVFAKTGVAVLFLVLSGSPCLEKGNSQDAIPHDTI